MGTYRDLAKQLILTIDAGGYGGLEWQALRAQATQLLGTGPATDDGKPQPQPIAYVYPSRSGGDPHVVIVTASSPPLLGCTCKAYLNVLAAMRATPEDAQLLRRSGCWAMQRTRDLLGLAAAG